MNEFTFDDVASPWELARARLKRGDVLSAQRFLTLMRSSEGISPEDAALELEEMGVMLDVRGLPRRFATKEAADRGALERMLLARGGWSERLDGNDPLFLFVRELPDLPHVSDYDTLAVQAAFGDREAMNRLADSYMGLVLAYAEEYVDQGVLLMDLVQEGSLGLWKGILAYQGGTFEGHAMWWIRQAMARAVTLQAEANGVGEYLAEQIERYQAAVRDLTRALGHTPPEERLAQELGITLEETMALGKLMGQILEMDKIRRENTPAEEQPEDAMAVEDTAYYQTRERVDDLMEGLSKQETMVLNMRYGLNGKAPLSVQETAVKMNLTPEEVSALEAGALSKMRGKQ